MFTIQASLPYIGVVSPPEALADQILTWVSDCSKNPALDETVILETGAASPTILNTTYITSKLLMNWFSSVLSILSLDGLFPTGE